MWEFFSKSSYLNTGILKGLTDWHSHILPGVDDGIETINDSIELLKEYERAGIRKVWLTPHIMEDIPNTTSSLKTQFELLKSEWHGNVELRLASENMLDSLFSERLKNGDLLPIGERGRHLLVETSYFNPPYRMEESLSMIREKGYDVLLAHPERYVYMDEKEYNKLKSQGVLFQLNLLSLTGMYGKVAQKKAQWLMQKGYVDLLGSDIHRYYHFNNFFGEKCLTKKTLVALSDIIQKESVF